MPKEWTVAIAGLGAIGLKVARSLDRGDIPRMTLSAVSARDHDGARAKMTDFQNAPDVASAGDLAGAEGLNQCLLVDNAAARRRDQKRAIRHAR